MKEGKKERRKSHPGREPRVGCDAGVTKGDGGGKETSRPIVVGKSCKTEEKRRSKEGESSRETSFPVVRLLQEQRRYRVDLTPIRWKM